MLIVFKHYFSCNLALKPRVHLLWTSWKPTATVCGYGITLMFTLDPPRKIRTTEWLPILQADGTCEQRMVYCVPRNCWGGEKIKPWVPAAHGRSHWWTPSAWLELQHHVRGILMRCHVCSRWGASFGIRSKQEAASAGPGYCLAGPHWNETKLNVCIEEVLLHWVYCLVDEWKLSLLMDVVFLSLNMLSSMDKLFTLCNILIMNVSSALLGKSRGWNKTNKRGKLNI